MPVSQRGDPRFVDVPLDMLLSKEHAVRWREKIASGEPLATLDAPESSLTNHLSVMDSDGNAVTMTHSIGSPAGAGVVTEGLGFLHNSHMSLFSPIPGTIDGVGGHLLLPLYSGRLPRLRGQTGWGT